MKHLTIIVPEAQGNLSSIVGAYKIFSRANQYHASRWKGEVFQIQLAGMKKEFELYDGLFAIRPHTTVPRIARTDLIIIPSLQHDVVKPLERNAEIIDWIAGQYRQGAEVASICTGAFLLAATGLLDGKNCSTHWNAAAQFKSRFPQVNLVTDQVITDEQGIYTNGGAFSFLNLLLYLVEKYYDRETAIYCSKVFQIDIDRNSQSPFIMFTGQKSHGDDMVRQAQEYIERHIDGKFSFEDLAANFMINRRSFDRRFIRATGNTPATYQQRVRVEVAKKAFETTRKPVQEVMFESGYTDVKAFREIFRKLTGLSPLEYRNRYNKEPGWAMEAY
ncbi:MAG: AraC family transcriptional regulator [Dyadobacter sp. 50-39]|uniref:GlxA family transcriptional regulator n=1 Tax=Dyadobacter sp. 50-39 TaxID=1895756 RepID=UPI00095E4C5C|nr:helix-turn-helix domain-containing protein [Dyadobacter sp. 50-39]OJV18051.1 MAG: AraC family transcriptional regulator [Dyadobacter sp. 50-39]